MEQDALKDKIRGSLMAGAAGDALGYEVEFISRRAIIARYGERGITKFALDNNGKALISDDTQMTLFTANGLLNALHLQVKPQNAVTQAYIEWYYTQSGKMNGIRSCWLSEIDALHSLRAPGNTCLSALGAISRGAEPCNDSKGCGGVMRVAPVGLLAASHTVCHRPWRDGEVFKLGTECAKITHKHPLGWLPAGLLTHIMYEIVERSLCKRIDRMEFEHIVGTAIHYMIAFSDCEDKYPLMRMIFRALELACQDISDAEAIRELGEGWTGDEALAIAIYCASRHIDSVEDAIIASVNHDGDSDSTGSVCGNIMGAIYGYEHIKQRDIFCPEGKRLEDTLELSEIILTIADDLSTGCIIDEYAPIDTPEKQQWYDRYCEMKPSGLKKTH